MDFFLRELIVNWQAGKDQAGMIAKLLSLQQVHESLLAKEK